jgi:hypothetical protein
MSRISFAVLLVVVSLSMASVTLSQDAMPGVVAGFAPVGGPIGDPWNRVPQPSGMRFVTPVSVQTGSVEGSGYGSGYGTGYGSGYAPCATCGNGGVCIHWSLVPWYGSWDDGHMRGGCRRGACGGGY